MDGVTPVSVLLLLASLAVGTALAECGQDDECIRQKRCPSFLALKDKFRELTKDTAEHSLALAGLKAAVCHPKRKLVCCPKPQALNATYLPVLGECGVSGDAAFIVGGEATKEGEFPWAALLGSARKVTSSLNGQEYESEKIQWTCGGVLINQWFVVTAAHCQGSSEKSRIGKVRLGEWRVAGYGESENGGNLPPWQEFTIGESDVTVHADYSTVTDDDGKKNILNDIALIKLPRPVTLNSGVRMVCLPSVPEEYRDALAVKDVQGAIEDNNAIEATVVGWGYTTTFNPWAPSEENDFKDYGIASRIQMKLVVPILGPDTCEGLDWRRPDESQVCAGGEAGKDSCNGDSGGGLFMQAPKTSGRDSRPFYLLGIVSYGSKYCGIGKPGMYTRVESFLPWIRETMATMA